MNGSRGSGYLANNRLIRERDAAVKRAEAAEALIDQLGDALDACDHATYGWSLSDAIHVIDKVRLIAREAVAARDAWKSRVG